MAEGKAQAHPFREWAKEREEILDRWRRKDRVREEITALLNLYSPGSAKITKAVKKKYGVEISRHRLSFKNIDEVVALIDEAFEAQESENKEREDSKRKIKALIEERKENVNKKREDRERKIKALIEETKERNKNGG